MNHQVVEARYVRDYVVWLRFQDGASGEIDLGPELHGEVFEPLRDPALFQAFTVKFDTLVWPNEADFSPEFLHDNIRVTA
jgi:hypothetical protein